MYNDSFFRHTHAMQTVLKDAGLIRSGIRSQTNNLKGGYWNRVMHYQQPGKNWVVKQFVLGDENLMFPNLPDHEAQALRDLDGSTIAPGFVGYIPDAEGGPVLVYQFQDGSDWRDDTASMGRLLRSLHDAPVTGTYRDLNIEPSDILAQSNEIMASVDSGDATWLKLETLRPQAVPHPGLEQRHMIHTDCGPGNVIVTEQGPVLIDWQCPGMGDPVEDLACFTSPGIQTLYGCPALTEVQITDLLDAYDDAIVIDRFHALRRFYHFRLAGYFLARTRSLQDSDADSSRRYDQALELELTLLEDLLP